MAAPVDAAAPAQATTRSGSGLSAPDRGEASATVLPGPAADVDSFDDILSWSTSVLGLSEDECEELALALFDQLGLLEACNVDPFRFAAFLSAVRALHGAHALSNWCHSVNALQATAVFLGTGGAGDKMTPVDALALALASLCRNAASSGVTNAFLVRTRSPLVMEARRAQAGSRGVQEVHTARRVRELLADEALDFTAGMEERPRAALRARLDQLLRSDMTDVLRVTERINERANPAYRGVAQPFASRNAGYEDQLLLLVALYRLAELAGTQGRHWAAAQHWGGLRCAQWALQGGRERAARLGARATSPLMRGSGLCVARIELGLACYFTAPLLRAVGLALPWFAGPPMEGAGRNALTWGQRVAQNMRSAPPERPQIAGHLLHSLHELLAPRRLAAASGRGLYSSLRGMGGGSGSLYAGGSGRSDYSRLGGGSMGGSARSRDGSGEEGRGPDVSAYAAFSGSDRDRGPQSLDGSFEAGRPTEPGREYNRSASTNQLTSAVAELLASDAAAWGARGVGLGLGGLPPRSSSQPSSPTFGAQSNPGQSSRRVFARGGSQAGSARSGGGSFGAASERGGSDGADRRREHRALRPSHAFDLAFTAPVVPELLRAEQLGDTLGGQLLKRNERVAAHRPRQTSMGIGGGALGSDSGPNYARLLARAAVRYGSAPRELALCVDALATQLEAEEEEEEEALLSALEQRMRLLSGTAHVVDSARRRQRYFPDRTLEEAVADHIRDALAALAAFQARPAARRLQRLIDSLAWRLLSCVLTLYVLFAPDIAYVYAPPAADGALRAVAVALFSWFLTDLAGRSLLEPLYLASWQSVVDAACTMCQLTDILSARVLLDGSRAARAGAVGARLGRTVRLVQLFQKTLVLLHREGEKRRAERRAEADGAREDSPRVGAAGFWARRPGLTSAESVALREQEEQFGVFPIEERTFSGAASEAGAGARGAEELVASSAGESTSFVWDMLSILLTRKLILGVLFIVTVYPLLEVIPPDASAALALAQLEAWPLFSLGFNTTLAVFAAAPPPAGVRLLSVAACAPPAAAALLPVGRLPAGCSGRRLSTVLGEAGSPFATAAADVMMRPRDVLVRLSGSGNSEAVYSLRGLNAKEAKDTMALMVCVIALLVSWLVSFARDVHALLIGPLVKMVSLIRLMATNPRKAVEQTHAVVGGVETETDKVIFTLLKVGNLLRSALGDAGLSIITANLMDSRKPFDPMVPGVRMQAAFCFADIRRFTDATECLEEEVMVFINKIAGIVHGATIASSGVPNKNIGDAFLLVWPVSTAQLAASATTISYADRALGAAIAILRDVDASATLAGYAKNTRIASRLGGAWRVKLGFGMHVGWAIEGAIGSKHKVDPSYLSPHVNLASRLESATKLYGVSILMSEHFVEALQLEEHHTSVRQIDAVRLKGSILPMGIFCYDDPDVVRSALLVPYAVYRARFSEGLQRYREGDWEEAVGLLQACAEDWPDDEPAKVLLIFMASFGNVPPVGWEGVRSLSEK